MALDVLKRGNQRICVLFGICYFLEFVLNRKAGSWCGPVWFLSLKRRVKAGGDAEAPLSHCSHQPPLPVRGPPMTAMGGEEKPLGLGGTPGRPARPRCPWDQGHSHVKPLPAQGSGGAAPPAHGSQVPHQQGPGPWGPGLKAQRRWELDKPKDSQAPQAGDGKARRRPPRPTRHLQDRGRSPGLPTPHSTRQTLFASQRH